LKVAYAFTTLGGADPVFTPYELLSMATVNAASILGWQDQVGSLLPGRLADLIVVDGVDGDAFTHLLTAAETEITLVMINGVARYGAPALVSAATNAAKSVTLKVGGKKRLLNLADAGADPAIGAITLDQAIDVLTEALHDLPSLEHTRAPIRAGMVAPAPAGVPQWRLALDELVDTGEHLRPQLAGATGPARNAGRSQPQPPAPLLPVALDALTVADDKDYLDSLQQQPNLPAGLAAAVAALYGS
jgi:hypothetical protein